MLKMVKKLMGIAHNGKDKKMDIKLKMMGEVDGKLFEFEKKLFSIQECVKYLKDVQSQLIEIDKIKDEKITKSIKNQFYRLFEMFEKDNTNLIIDENNRLKKDIKLQTVIYEDKKNKFKFNDIDKDIKKYKNPFNINKIIKKARVK